MEKLIKGAVTSHTQRYYSILRPRIFTTGSIYVIDIDEESSGRVPPLDTCILLYFVRETDRLNGRVRERSLTEHENPLIEYFDPNRLYSYVNGPEAFDWGSE